MRREVGREVLAANKKAVAATTGLSSVTARSHAGAPARRPAAPPRGPGPAWIPHGELLFAGDDSLQDLGAARGAGMITLQALGEPARVTDQEIPFRTGLPCSPSTGRLCDYQAA
jgi:hypothetical protein